MTTLDPGFVAVCEREALHQIGAIQPYGALLGGRGGDATIRCASADLELWLGIAADAALGQTLRGLLQRVGTDTPALAEQLDNLDRALAEPAATPDRPGHAEKLMLADLAAGERGRLDGILSRTADTWVLELEPALPSGQQQQVLRPVPHALYRMPHSEQEWQAHCQLLAEQMQFLNGFERIMVYRFLPDGCGEVVAEVAAPGLAPYLGLRYPASDIPQIARELYLANRHRQIPDASATNVPLVAEPDFLPDLSLSDLRAVSPVHIEYLHNMEVTASLSFSVVLNGRLWGLIACHHHEPRAVALQLRERCADLVQVFSLGASGYYNNRRLIAVADSDRDIARLATDIARLEAGADQDFQLDDALLALTEADGALLADNQRGLLNTFGRTPDRPELRKLLRWLDEHHPEPVYATDALADEYEPAAAYQRDACGLLAVRVGSYQGAERVERCFVWLRPEQPQTVYWAGDPRKSTLFDSQSQTLSPRSSFAAWLETKTGHADPWSDTVLLCAKKFRSLLLQQVNAELLGG